MPNYRWNVGSLGDFFKRLFTPIPNRDALVSRIAALEQTNRELREKITDSEEEIERQVYEKTLHMMRVIQALEESNKELEQFAHIAAHDLKEPLLVIKNCVELLKRQYQGKLDQKADEFIRYAVDSATQAQKLIRDILEYSLSGKEKIILEEIDCEELLVRCENNLRSRIEESGAVITHDPLPHILGNFDQMLQVFQNLIGNAIKFHGDRPIKIHVAAVQEGQEWTFSISDNGIGIATEHLDKVFAPFKRLNPRNDYEGSGIGLAICRKVVARHGGRIWAESTPGEGSVFCFTMPVSETASVQV